jgi:signal transduction histidine kinase
VTRAITAPDEVLRAISHDILEPLRTIRWYAEKFSAHQSVGLNKDGFSHSESFKKVVAKSQISFKDFYESYKSHREISFYKRYAEEILQEYIEKIVISFVDLKPYLNAVTFNSRSISVGECNRIIHRLNRRYEGLVHYLEMPDSLSLIPINLAKEFNRVFDDLSAARDSLAISDDAVAVYGEVVDEFDQMLIGLLFQNLLMNSFKFQSKERAPNITLHMWTINKLHLKNWLDPEIFSSLCSSVPSNETHLLMFQDNGIGIPSKYKKSIFDAYFQVPKAKEYGGSGMGLAIVQSAVNRHSGFIWLDTKKQNGVRFFVAFPVHGNDWSKLPLRELRAALM